MAARPHSETSAAGALQKPKNLTRWLACSQVLSLLANPWCGHLYPELAAAGAAGAVGDARAVRGPADTTTRVSRQIVPRRGAPGVIHSHRGEFGPR